MGVLMILEHRSLKPLDVRVWTTGSHFYSFFRRYLEVFVLDIPQHQPGSIQTDGPNIRVLAVPYFVSPAACAKRFWAVRRAIAEAWAFAIFAQRTEATAIGRDKALESPFAIERSAQSLCTLYERLVDSEDRVRREVSSL
jgi:hypothetical protein